MKDFVDRVAVVTGAAGGIGRAMARSFAAAGMKVVLAVNLMGVIHGIHTFLPIMLEQGVKAHVVNTASNSGLVMNAYAVPYGVSKHAVVALSESLHLELMQRNSRVKVSLLCPGPVNTDILNASQRNLPEYVPMPEQETPEEMLFKKAYEIYIERGLDPEGVGLAVLEAIREEQFYIITHDYSNAIEMRMQNILAAQNPEPQPPTPEFMKIVQELTGK